MLSESFNSHTARGSSSRRRSANTGRKEVSIPILRVGVQGRLPKYNHQSNRFNSHTARGSSSVEDKNSAIQRSFNSHTARGSSKYTHNITAYLATFQFPYCTWEFKPILPRLLKSGGGFNSHTARGSSNVKNPLYEKFPIQVSIPILHVGVQNPNTFGTVIKQWFQFPYCTWEFKRWHLQCPFYQVSESY